MDTIPTFIKAELVVESKYPPNLADIMVSYLVPDDNFILLMDDIKFIYNHIYETTGVEPSSKDLIWAVHTLKKI